MFMGNIFLVKTPCIVAISESLNRFFPIFFNQAENPCVLFENLLYPFYKRKYNMLSNYTVVVVLFTTNDMVQLRT